MVKGPSVGAKFPWGWEEELCEPNVRWSQGQNVLLLSGKGGSLNSN